MLRMKRFLYQRKLRQVTEAHQISAKSVLITAYNTGIGNCIETTPLIAAARSLWPDAKIFFLTNYSELFKGWCIPDRVTNTISELQDIVFDVAFIGFTGQYQRPDWIDQIRSKKIFYPKIALNSYFLKSEREYNIDMIRKMGFKGTVPPVYVSLKRPDIVLPQGIRVGILPCSQQERPWELKRWPHYGELINLLSQFPELSIIILGTKDDLLDVDIVKSDNILDLRGKTKLNETAWLLKHCDLIVGNDCGPAHIAGAVHVKQLVLFGPSCPVKNRPQSSDIICADACKCAPCQYSKIINTCKDPRCMLDISAVQIFNYIKRELQIK